MFPFERSKTTIPGQTIRPNDGIFTNPRSCNHGSDIDHTRPETHQNLIYSIKEQRHPNRAACKRRDHTTQGALPGQMIKPNSGHSAIQTNGRRGPKLAVSGARAGVSSRPGFPSFASKRLSPLASKTPAPDRQPCHSPRRRRWWRRSGSNRRPPACKAGALPAELRPQWSVQWSVAWISVVSRIKACDWPLTSDN